MGAGMLPSSLDAVIGMKGLVLGVVFCDVNGIKVVPNFVCRFILVTAAPCRRFRCTLNVFGALCWLDQGLPGLTTCAAC